MPYNIIKNSKGKYKVRYEKGGKMHTIPGASGSKEKAKKRIAAIERSKHMNESLENNYVGPFMFKRVFQTRDEEGNEYGVSYQIRGGTITFYYRVDRSTGEAEFKRGFVNDSGSDFILTFNEEDEDFQDKLAEIENKYKISFDDIELAVQDGYERFKEYYKAEQEKSEEIRKRHSVKEDLSFESYFKNIIG